MRKAIGKQALERGRVLDRAYLTACDAVNGRRNASYMINLLLNDGFRQADARRVYEGQATEKQLKALKRLLYGRHYSLETFQDLLLFFQSPETFNGAVPVKAAIAWVNATAIEPQRPIMDADQLAAYNAAF